MVHRTDGKPFALAGIWQRTSDGEDQCAVITGDAQGEVAALHNRMPIVIAPEGYERWLDARERPLDLLVPKADDLVAHPVSELVNSPKNDSPRLVEPVELNETLSLF